MSKRNRIVERASDVNGGQYIQTNSSYNSGYEDGKKAGKEYCASEIEALREQVEKLTAALKLSREALFDMQDSYVVVHGWKDSFVIAATTALAAIDEVLKGE